METRNAPDWVAEHIVRIFKLACHRLLIGLQDNYYLEHGIRKHGTTWASKVIMQGWGIIYKMWLNQNDVLHQKEIREILLDVEVERAYDAGYADLPVVVHKWFHQTREQLLAQYIEYKKGWLVIVKTVKETLQIAEYSIFTGGSCAL